MQNTIKNMTRNMEPKVAVTSMAFGVALMGPPAQNALANPDGRNDAPENKAIITVSGCNNERVTLSQGEYLLFLLHNEKRAEAGLQPVCLSKKLTETSKAYSERVIADDYDCLPPGAA